jgi:hypothetical protein
LIFDGIRAQAAQPLPHPPPRRLEFTGPYRESTGSELTTPSPAS